MATKGVSPSLQHVLLTGSPGVGKTTLVCRVCEILRERGCGPSTLQGFYTQEVREDVGGRGRGKRVGFDIVTFDGKRSPLARVESAESAVPPLSRPSPTVGKYRVNLASFESLALPALQIVPRLPHSGSTPSPAGKGGGACPEGGGATKGCAGKKMLMVIDEVGKMELFSRSFVDRVKTLFDIATVPASHAPTSTEGVDKGGVVLLATIPVQRPQQKQHWLLESIRRRKDCWIVEVTEQNRDYLVEEIVTFISHKTDS